MRSISYKGFFIKINFQNSLPETVQESLGSTEYLEVTAQSNTESESNETICQNESFQDEKLIPSNPPQAHRPISWVIINAQTFNWV